MKRLIAVPALWFDTMMCSLEGVAMLGVAGMAILTISLARSLDHGNRHA